LYIVFNKFMKYLKILPIIAIALLAACKSTDLVAKNLIDICFADYQKAIGDSSCFDPEISSCSIEFQEKKFQLSKRIAYEHHHGMHLILLTITNGKAAISEEFIFFGNEKLTKICSDYKNDSTKKNVKCTDNVITYTIGELISDEDLKDILDQLYAHCQKTAFSTQKQCSYIQNRQSKNEDDYLPDLNLEVFRFDEEFN